MLSRIAPEAVPLVRVTAVRSPQVTDGAVGFELYGPYPPGTKRDDGDPYDGRGLAGSMTTACLKSVLSLLAKGHSPVDYVRGSALSASVVVDD